MSWAQSLWGARRTGPPVSSSSVQGQGFHRGRTAKSLVFLSRPTSFSPFP